MTTFNRSPLESNFQDKLIKYIKTTYKRNAWFLNVCGSATQRSGVPDVICVINGKFIALELKREDGSGRPSEQQLIECKKINQVGGYAIVTDNFNKAKKFIERVANL